MKTRLNERELVIAFVMADLFEKGNPETRIAEYCILKKMNPRQLLNFLAKIKTLPEDVKLTIFKQFNLLSNDVTYGDEARRHGYAMRLFLENVS
jgi:hypothetical protein